MNTISLCCTTKNTNRELLQQMIHSAVGFDEIVLHFNETMIDFNNPKIKYFDNTSSFTAAEGYNFCVQNAKSEWICCMGNDDHFDIPNLERLLLWFKNAKLDDIDIIQFPMWVGNENVNDWNVWGLELASYDELRKRNMITFASFYRKSLWKKIGGYDNLPFNDWKYWLKALKNNAKIYYWPYPIYYQRQGIELRLSDKEYKKQNYELTRQQILESLDNENL